MEANLRLAAVAPDSQEIKTTVEAPPDDEPTPEVGPIEVALRALPEGKLVSLRDAAFFALFGGVPTFVPPDGVTQKELELGFPFARSDGTCCIRLTDSAGRDRLFVGPVEVELAACGSVLYDLPADWRAEREEAFFSTLGAAARDGEVTFRGRRVPFARVDADEGEQSADIPAGYFDQEGEFLPEENLIWANDRVEGHLLLPTADPAWKAVVVDREEFLAFLDKHYPAVRGKAGQNRMRSVKAKRDDVALLVDQIRKLPDLTKQQAARLLGYQLRSRPFDEIWKSAWNDLGQKPPRGRRKKSAHSAAKAE